MPDARGRRERCQSDNHFPSAGLAVTKTTTTRWRSASSERPPWPQGFWKPTRTTIGLQLARNQLARMFQCSVVCPSRQMKADTTSSRTIQTPERGWNLTRHFLDGMSRTICCRASGCPTTFEDTANFAYAALPPNALGSRIGEPWRITSPISSAEICITLPLLK